jgi:hypothetical protein
MENKEFVVDGFILVARPCRETEVIEAPSVVQAFNLHLENDDDCRVGVVVEIVEGYRVFSDVESKTFSKMQGAVRRAWELFNLESGEDELDDWNEIQNRLEDMGYNYTLG